ncbi:uncharacterized protein LOC125497458 [Beta vulgaris subsp. vulgaris]|uniref:uncharacterized protein LOC125497458 n=1 Tax=Beta vulgaris subsp. vulgaris TaxID=3555 RepID=UPI002036C380|nr:uncharacterized protein LOC125497458 [Beta vulgaris subsp. vulgaris]
MEGRPWTFDQHLIGMDNIEDGIQPSEITLSWSPFWVRLYNLPMNARTEYHVRRIGKNIGTVMDVDYDGVCLDKSSWVRVMVDFSKPLRLIIKMKNSNEIVVVVEVKYERLPIFCFSCGRIRNMESDCEYSVENDREGEKQWGTWLKASPRKGCLKKLEEAKQFLSCSRALNFSRHAWKQWGFDESGGGGVGG